MIVTPNTIKNIIEAAGYKVVEDNKAEHHQASNNAHEEKRLKIKVIFALLVFSKNSHVLTILCICALSDKSLARVK